MAKRVSHSLLDPWLTRPIVALYPRLRIPTTVPPEAIVVIGHLCAIAGAVGFALAGSACWAGLMAAAGVSYTIGRESNATYGETLNGVHFGQRHHQFDVAVDPYVVEGDPASGLLPGVHGDDPGQEGQGDHRVQAYCLRMCLTKNKKNQIPFAKPPGYDSQRYELLARYLRNAEAAGKLVKIFSHGLIQGEKTDTNNNGGFSTDHIGMNYDYPQADHRRRQAIFQDHLAYQQGLM